MKKSIKILGIFIIFIFLFYYFLETFSEKKDEIIKINDSEFLVEVADRDSKRQKGLGGRVGLCDRCGMLFVFDEVGRHGFWMKDMKFDIDILWIRNGEIVHIEKRVPHKTPEIIYNPDIESDMVLELEAGVTDEFEIKVGYRINF